MGGLAGKGGGRGKEDNPCGTVAPACCGDGITPSRSWIPAGWGGRFRGKGGGTRAERISIEEEVDLAGCAG